MSGEKWSAVRSPSRVHPTAGPVPGSANNDAAATKATGGWVEDEMHSEDGAASSGSGLRLGGDALDDGPNAHGRGSAPPARLPEAKPSNLGLPPRRSLPPIRLSPVSGSLSASPPIRLPVPSIANPTSIAEHVAAHTRISRLPPRLPTDEGVVDEAWVPPRARLGATRTSCAAGGAAGETEHVAAHWALVKRHVHGLGGHVLSAAVRNHSPTAKRNSITSLDGNGSAFTKLIKQAHMFRQNSHVVSNNKKKENTTDKLKRMLGLGVRDMGERKDSSQKLRSHLGLPDHTAPPLSPGAAMLKKLYKTKPTQAEEKENPRKRGSTNLAEVAGHALEETGHVTVDSNRLRGKQGKTLLTTLHKKAEKARAKVFARSIFKHLLVAPNSTFKTGWDALVKVCLLITFILLPLELAFEEDLGGAIARQTLGVLMDIVFVLDIVVSFRTCYLDKHNELVADSRQIAKKYMSKWFWIDLPASVPLDAFIPNAAAVVVNVSFSNATNSGGPGVGRLLKSTRLMKMIRLLRLARIGGKHKSSMFGQFVGYGKIMRLLLYFVMTAHLYGCFYYFIADLDESPDSMLIARKIHSDQFNGHWGQAYFHILYLTLLMFIGDGVDPQSMSETILATFGIVFGAGMTAILFGQMALLVTTFNRARTGYLHRIEEVEMHMKSLKISQSLRRRILEYYDYQWHLNQCLDREEFIGGLSEPLSKEVLFNLFGEMLTGVSFFSSMSLPCVVRIVRELGHAMFLPGDYIIRGRERGHRMFFITTGVCEVLVGPDLETVVHICRKGDHFGEVALISPGAIRSASVRAQTHCDLQSLDYDSLSRILENYPDDQKKMHGEIQKILRHTEDHPRLKDGLNMAAKDKEEEAREEDPTIRDVMREVMGIRKRDHHLVGAIKHIVGQNRVVHAMQGFTQGVKRSVGGDDGSSGSGVDGGVSGRVGRRTSMEQLVGTLQMRQKHDGGGGGGVGGGVGGGPSAGDAGGVGGQEAKLTPFTRPPGKSVTATLPETVVVQKAFSIKSSKSMHVTSKEEIDHLNGGSGGGSDLVDHLLDQHASSSSHGAIHAETKAHNLGAIRRSSSHASHRTIFTAQERAALERDDQHVRSANSMSNGGSGGSGGGERGGWGGTQGEAGGAAGAIGAGETGGVGASMGQQLMGSLAQISSELATITGALGDLASRTTALEAKLDARSGEG